MADTLNLALAQINTTVGDIAGNLDRIRAARAEAKGQGADLVVFPELTVSGYPPEDLVLKPLFQDRAAAAIETLAAETKDGGPAIVVGDLVFFSTLEQKTYAARAADGRIVWRLPIGKYSPGIATERAYYFSLNGILAAYEGRGSP